MLRLICAAVIAAGMWCVATPSEAHAGACSDGSRPVTGTPCGNCIDAHPGNIAACYGYDAPTPETDDQPGPCDWAKAKGNMDWIKCKTGLGPQTEAQWQEAQNNQNLRPCAGDDPKYNACKP